MQLIQIGTTDVAQFDPLEVIPDPLVGIEIGCIPRQLLQVQSFGGSSFEEYFDLVGAVDRRTVPDQQDLVVLQEMAVMGYTQQDPAE